MVLLSLQPYRGNHQRFFPSHGYLGLTPLIVQGIVRTTFEEDQKSIKASSISVRLRCYEVDCSPAAKDKGGRVLRVLKEVKQELWRKGDGKEWEDVGEFERSFRLVLGPEEGLCSTTTFKSFRIWWQVEAGNYLVFPFHPFSELTTLHSLHSAKSQTDSNARKSETHLAPNPPHQSFYPPSFLPSNLDFSQLLPSIILLHSHLLRIIRTRRTILSSRGIEEGRSIDGGEENYRCG